MFAFHDDLWSGCIPTYKANSQGDTINTIIWLKWSKSADQWKWTDYVGRAKFSCNVATHLATKNLPLVVAYGVDALQPTNLALKGRQSTKMVRTWPKTRNTYWKWPSCCWRKPKRATKINWCWNTQIGVGGRPKNNIKCEQLHLGWRLHSKVHVQICGSVSHFWTRKYKNWRYRTNQNASVIPCLIVYAIQGRHLVTWLQRSE